MCRTRESIFESEVVLIYPYIQNCLKILNRTSLAAFLSLKNKHFLMCSTVYIRKLIATSRKPFGICLCFKLFSPSRFAVDRWQIPFSSLEFNRRISAGRISLLYTLTTSPTTMSAHFLLRNLLVLLKQQQNNNLFIHKQNSIENNS